MPNYRVIVGNIGTVYDDTDGQEARRLFNLYVEQSKSGRGRAGNEDVGLYEDDEQLEWYVPPDENDYDDAMAVHASDEECYLNGDPPTDDEDDNGDDPMTYPFGPTPDDDNE